MRKMCGLFFVLLFPLQVGAGFSDGRGQSSADDPIRMAQHQHARGTCCKCERYEQGNWIVVGTVCAEFGSSIEERCRRAGGTQCTTIWTK
ncbi:hypothetical protein Desti_0594 [Desulfomonile tiedjei DSM 6799]|uniref:Uncharacterized protein n=1 Tax=Desulfomonile tiedjei (strain ATCC 49306 / DSM 6799 / DCB-1) TaxID=706587 RepID=I4C183_DESTA|nr:hypothetical protein Desti_0594 [Desulfomonile tiedjei DSM 6799]